MHLQSATDDALTQITSITEKELSWLTVCHDREFVMDFGWHINKISNETTDMFF